MASRLVLHCGNARTYLEFYEECIRDEISWMHDTSCESKPFMLVEFSCINEL